LPCRRKASVKRDADFFCRGGQSAQIKQKILCGKSRPHRMAARRPETKAVKFFERFHLFTFVNAIEDVVSFGPGHTISSGIIALRVQFINRFLGRMSKFLAVVIALGKYRVASLQVRNLLNNLMLKHLIKGEMMVNHGNGAGSTMAMDDNGLLRFSKMYFFALLIIVIAELIGSVAFNVGPGKVVLLPMIWALLMGAVLGWAKDRLPGPLSIDTRLQYTAAMILQPALLLFIAKLGLMVGGSIPKIIESGWALMFQELGHFVGTIMLGLPLALLLGIKREAIGATFSVGREPSLAIIGERFGMDSPEGRGVLAEYITGTVFGAVFIAVFAGFITSLGIFDPVALAMGAGVGSGSMMAAAAGAISAQQTPEVAKEVMTFAAASNLITTTIGTYFTLFISLPLAIWGYRVMEPILGRKSAASTSQQTGKIDDPADIPAPLTTTGIILAWVVSGVLVLIANWVMPKGLSPFANGFELIIGMAVILAAVGVGALLNIATCKVIPAVCWVSFVAMALTYPACPWADQVNALTGKINFMAFVTPLLTYAGLSIAKDIPAFRRLGWRIVVVSFAANAGTFIGATLIAQFFRH
jgi:hypothetical protein